jgi:hypothetical protein
MRPGLARKITATRKFMGAGVPAYFRVTGNFRVILAPRAWLAAFAFPCCVGSELVPPPEVRQAGTICATEAGVTPPERFPLHDAGGQPGLSGHDQEAEP